MYMFYLRIATMYTIQNYMIVYLNWTVDLYITLDLDLSDRQIKHANYLSNEH